MCDFVMGHFGARKECHHVVQIKFSLLAQQIVFQRISKVLPGNIHDAVDGRQLARNLL